MEIPSNSPTGPSSPVDKNPQKKEESTVGKNNRKVTIVDPEIRSSAPDGTIIIEKPLPERTIESVIIEPENLPSIQSKSSNVSKFPDGTLFIEADKNPEESAEKLVKKIKKEHGEEEANKAKAFFKGVLSFCKEHKSAILGVVGFAFMVGGIAGGIAFPAVFVIAVPGIIMFACGIGGLLDDIPTPPIPPTPTPEDKPPKNKPDDSKKETPAEPETKKTSTSTTQTGEVETETNSSADFVPPKPGDAGYEDYKSVQDFRKKFKEDGGQAHFLPAKPGTMEYSEILRAIKNENKPDQGSALTPEDFADITIEETLDQHNFTEEEKKRIYAEYSKVSVGFDYYLWDRKVQEKHPEINSIRKKELIALRKSLKREALNIAVDAVKNKKAIHAYQLSLEAGKRVKNLTKRLSIPANSNEEKIPFASKVDSFLVAFANSFKLKKS